MLRTVLVMISRKYRIFSFILSTVGQFSSLLPLPFLVGESFELYLFSFYKKVIYFVENYIPVVIGKAIMSCASLWHTNTLKRKKRKEKNLEGTKAKFSMVK